MFYARSWFLDAKSQSNPVIETGTNYNLEGHRYRIP